MSLHEFIMLKSFSSQHLVIRKEQMHINRPPTLILNELESSFSSSNLNQTVIKSKNKAKKKPVGMKIDFF